MGTLKNNGLRACLALMILLFGVFIVVKAMGHKSEASQAKAVVNTEFRYKGSDTSIGSITNAGNWEISDGTESCELGELPCVVAPNMSSITNESQLVSYLNSLTPANAISFVEDNATKHRD
ncbi:hypothetical protein GCM10009120_27010 [Sphingobacterium siyangense subsp. cladoniae]|uniref:hypothetical protein n=1 Tax=Sphingobacterium siyangense TaxID=459529 RepID=UPI0031F903D2